MSDSDPEPLRPLGPDGRPDRRGLSPYDRQRLRPSVFTAFAGFVLGLAGALIIGVLGASGAAGVAVVLAVSAAGSVLAALVTAVLAMVDEYRHRPVGRPRTLAALGFFLGGAVLLIMSTGAAGAAATAASAGAAVTTLVTPPPVGVPAAEVTVSRV